MLRLLASSLALTMIAHASPWLPLWPDCPAPGAEQAPAGTETVQDERVGHVEVPQYQLFLPPAEKATGQGVVIFPGGGYGIVSMPNEGWPLAKWLNGQGIAAIVVKYRVDASGKLGYTYPVPLLDARRAIRTMRHNANEWNISPDKIGVLGFSAGGHLAAMSSTLYSESFTAETADEIDSVSCRPDFSTLVYPVIDMANGFGHDGSTRFLTGGDDELAKTLSLHTRVTAATPPTLLVHATDDLAVPVQNSLAYAQACADQKVPVTLHVYPSGGHGFGMGRESEHPWVSRYADWLKGQ